MIYVKAASINKFVKNIKKFRTSSEQSKDLSHKIFTQLSDYPDYKPKPKPDKTFNQTGAGFFRNSVTGV